MTCRAGTCNFPALFYMLKTGPSDCRVNGLHVVLQGRITLRRSMGTLYRVMGKGRLSSLMEISNWSGVC